MSFNCLQSIPDFVFNRPFYSIDTSTWGHSSPIVVVTAMTPLYLVYELRQRTAYTMDLQFFTNEMLFVYVFNKWTSQQNRLRRRWILAHICRRGSLYETFTLEFAIPLSFVDFLVSNASPTPTSASSNMYVATILDACELLKARMEPITSKKSFSSFPVRNSSGTCKISSLNDVPLKFSVALLKGVPIVKDATAAARAISGYKEWFPLDSPATPERIRMVFVDEFTSRFVDRQSYPKLSI